LYPHNGKGPGDELAHLISVTHFRGGMELGEQIANGGGLGRPRHYLKAAYGREKRQEKVIGGATAHDVESRGVLSCASLAFFERPTDRQRHAVEQAAHKFGLASWHGLPVSSTRLSDQPRHITGNRESRFRCIDDGAKRGAGLGLCDQVDNLCRSSL